MDLVDLVQYDHRVAAGRMVNVHEAKTHLSRLLDEVAAGDEIVLAKAGTPCARLVPLDRPGERPLGFVDGSVGEEFFEPLDPAELAAWE